MNLLIAFHSLMRWLVLISLVYSIYRAYSGWIKNGVFGKWDNKLRHYTATIAHIQLVIGYVVYFKSAIVSFFLANFKTSLANTEMLFFWFAPCSIDDHSYHFHYNWFSNG